MFIPPWTLDAAALGATLDRLRTALQVPVTAPGSTAVSHDRARVLSSLQEVLGCLDRTDLAARSALSSFVTEFRPVTQVEVLKNLFDGLRDGWRSLVTRRLGTAKLLLIKKLLASPSPDVLKILGREDDENSHSDLIAWLLNPRKAPTIAPPALRDLVTRFADSDQWIARLDAAPPDTTSVRREVLIAREITDEADLCRVDLVVAGPGFVLAIENKVWSNEHSDQTTTYWNWLEPMRCLRGGLILSPSGMPAGSPAFAAVSYLDLVNALLAGPVVTPMDAREEIVLASYLRTLARFILPVEFRAILEAAAEVSE